MYVETAAGRGMQGLCHAMKSFIGEHQHLIFNSLCNRKPVWVLQDWCNMVEFVAQGQHPDGIVLIEL